MIARRAQTGTLSHRVQFGGAWNSRAPRGHEARPLVSALLALGWFVAGRTRRLSTSAREVRREAPTPVTPAGQVDADRISLT